MPNNTIHDAECVVFDVETTGLSPQSGDRIVEIAAVKIQRMQPVDEFVSLVDPQRPVSYGAFAVNGITDEMLAGAPRAGEVLPRFMDFAGTAPLVAHNISFDVGFLTAELSLVGLQLPDSTILIDTLKMARGLLPGLMSYSLQSVAQALDIRKPQRHRALADVQMTVQIWCKLIDIAQRKSIITVDALDTLFGNRHAGRRAIKEDTINLITDAIAQQKDLDISYFSFRRAATTARRVTPKKLTPHGNGMMLTGFCHLRNEERGFRLERILHLQRV